MKQQEITTTNLAYFGIRERKELINILNTWNKYGLPADFETDEVIPMFNSNSGFVFLTNSEYQVCMLNGDKLDLWHTCRECGHEGFKEDFQVYDNGCTECILEGE